MKINEVKTNYKKMQERLTETCNQFNWENREHYTQWLIQTYEYARYSTRILALAAGKFPLEMTTFSNRFVQHAAEEKGHDHLIENDARNLDFDIKKSKPTPEAEAFHKSLYYWIYEGNPSVILGWVLCLEGFAVESGPKIYNRIEKTYGKKATTFVALHSVADEDHLAKAFATLEKLPEDQLEFVNHGLEIYTRLYETIFRSINEKISYVPTQKAA